MLLIASSLIAYSNIDTSSYLLSFKNLWITIVDILLNSTFIENITFLLRVL